MVHQHDVVHHYQHSLIAGANCTRKLIYRWVLEAEIYGLVLYHLYLWISGKKKNATRSGWSLTEKKFLYYQKYIYNLSFPYEGTLLLKDTMYLTPEKVHFAWKSHSLLITITISTLFIVFGNYLRMSQGH